MTTDEHFMSRALYLATLGAGRVSPNPLVGCVVVQGTKIVGEGWHERWGEPHAEDNALNGMKDHASRYGATVYVNLEPCSHVGKRPPCVDLLIRHNVQRVVISNIDPDPRVSGTGVLRLEKVGIKVKKHVLCKDGERLNRRFFTFHRKKRPYIILKWAQTYDGFIARTDYTSKWISNIYARKWSHKWRAEEDAVLVGRRTATYDDPRLTTRLWCGRNPTRITIDPLLKLDSNLHLFDKKTPTICYNLLKNEVRDGLSFVRLDKPNFTKQLVGDLYQKNIQSVMVEGGAHTLKSFVDLGLWDEARVFSAPVQFGSGIEAPIIRGNLLEMKRVLDNKLMIYSNNAGL